MKNRRTQKQTVLQHLRTHKRGLTSMYAFEHWGITRLSDIIFRLRGEGHDITSIQETTKNRYGYVVNYARYVLEG